MPTPKKPAPLGARQHSLTLIEEVPCQQYECSDATRRIRMVRCLCDCGVEKVIELRNFLRGLTKSCGCRRAIVGRRIGKACHSRKMVGGVPRHRAAQKAGLSPSTVANRVNTLGWDIEKALSAPPRARKIQRVS